MIRIFENKDTEKIMEIWLESTIKGHDFIEKEYWEKSYDTVKNVYIPMAETFVYEENGKIKGFISVINKEFIGALFVHIDFQGTGVGKELINYAIGKYNKLELAVYKRNKRAVKFYEDRGFEIIEEKINEDSGHKEYLMKKD
ncbi:MAG: N-acetyltransferase [Romboutsia sp.]|uniref:N-acetyltransferase n=1 Tax=Romboutsia sp. TaxID=1965302 RepID=UPI003F34EB3B